MKNSESRENTPGQSWKPKMGTEFSGLERPGDFIIAIAVWIGIVLIAMVIAFLAFS